MYVLLARYVLVVNRGEVGLVCINGYGSSEWLRNQRPYATVSSMDLQYLWYINMVIH